MVLKGASATSCASPLLLINNPDRCFVTSASQACWQAGVDLGELLTEYETKKRELAERGVPGWKQELVREC